MPPTSNPEREHDMSETTTDLGFEIRMEGPMDGAVETVTAALQQKGFGILTTIDLKGAFAEKLGVEFRPYLILGACNPRLAHRAVSARPEVGMLLPCNVTVESGPGDAVTVRITDPRAMFAAGDFGGDPVMESVVDEARELLMAVAEDLRGEAPEA